MPESKDPFNNTSGLVVSEIEPKIPSVEYPTAYSSDIKINSILESMDVYDRNHINTQIMREKLAKKLMDAAISTNLDESDPEALDVNLHVLMEARNILNDLDKAAKDNVAVKLKKKDTENAEASNINMAEFLSKIKISDMRQFDTGTIVQTADEINANLARLEKDNNISILETELETSGNMLPEKPENTDD
jgi:ATP-dependent RNA circularization protein (DNA/RNA ligase family)